MEISTGGFPGVSEMRNAASDGSRGPPAGVLGGMESRSSCLFHLSRRPGIRAESLVFLSHDEEIQRSEISKRSGSHRSRMPEVSQHPGRREDGGTGVTKKYECRKVCRRTESAVSKNHKIEIIISEDLRKHEVVFPVEIYELFSTIAPMKLRLNPSRIGDLKITIQIERCQNEQTGKRGDQTDSQ